MVSERNISSQQVFDYRVAIVSSPIAGFSIKLDILVTDSRIPVSQRFLVHGSILIVCTESISGSLYRILVDSGTSRVQIRNKKIVCQCRWREVYSK